MKHSVQQPDKPLIELARLHMQQHGISQRDFGDRIGYSGQVVKMWLNGSYGVKMNGDLEKVNAAIQAYLDENDDATPISTEKLYETADVALIRGAFYEALDGRCAITLRGAPGTRKTWLLKRLSIELLQIDAAKNGHGRRAWYVRCCSTLTPAALAKRIARACGTFAGGSTETVINNLKFHLRKRRCLLVFDEAQSLNFDCRELVRELLDEIECGVLLAGSHELEDNFSGYRMQQWRSRIVRAVSIPGMTAEDASMILRAEIPRISNTSIKPVIDKCWERDLYQGRDVRYLSARLLFLSIKKYKLSQQAKAVSA